MKKYVVGFAFSKDKKDMVLIKKNKPEWQRGKFNGIGGKMEFDEYPRYSMVREFKEETGVETTEDMWHYFATLTFDEAILHCFRMYDNCIYNCKTQEDEEIFRLAVDTALGEFRNPLINNLKVLIPMALDEDFDYSDIKAIVR